MKVNRRQFLTGAGAAAAAAALMGRGVGHAVAGNLPGTTKRTQAAATAMAPNIILVLADDQDYQSWADQFTLADGRGNALLGADGEPQKGWAMPFLKSQPGGGWVDFTTTVATHSICAPARGTLLTGVYSRDHGVIGNGLIGKLDATNTLPVWLRNNGYDTALYGKYSFGTKDRQTPRPPGWTVFERGGRSSTVFNKGVKYIESVAAQPDPRPFMLCLWPGDPHRPYRVLHQHKKTKLIPPPLQPNVNEEDVSDKPEWVRRQRLVNARGVNGQRVDYYKSVMAIDWGIEQIYKSLSAHNMLDNTIIIFASDNGFMWGNHRLKTKDAPYEEACRVPLVMRLPWLTENRTEARVVSHVDITATIIEATGVTPGRQLAGQSLLQLASDPATPWPGVAYMGGSGKDGSIIRPEWHGLRTGGDAIASYTYAEYPATGEVELYDMATDPAQLQNVAGLPEYAEIQATLAAMLQEKLNS